MLTEPAFEGKKKKDQNKKQNQETKETDLDNFWHVLILLEIFSLVCAK